MKFQNHRPLQLFHPKKPSSIKSKSGRSSSSSKSTSSSLIRFFLYLVFSQRHTIAILCFLAVSVTIVFHVDWITTSKRSSNNNESSTSSSSLGIDLINIQQAARISKAATTATAEIPTTATMTTTTTNNNHNNIRHQHHQEKQVLASQQ